MKVASKLDADRGRVADRLAQLGYKVDTADSGTLHMRLPPPAEGAISICPRWRCAELGWISFPRLARSVVGSFKGRDWQERLADACDMLAKRILDGR
jgi:hypothetical protein